MGSPTAKPSVMWLCQLRAAAAAVVLGILRPVVMGCHLPSELTLREASHGSCQWQDTAAVIIASTCQGSLSQSVIMRKLQQLQFTRTNPQSPCLVLLDFKWSLSEWLLSEGCL